MINPATATHSKHELNEFTKYIADHPDVLVEMRDGTAINATIFLGEDDWEDDYNKPRGFKTENWSHCWHLDGSSVTNSRFDMMKLIGIKLNGESCD